MRQRLFLDAVDRALQLGFVFGILDVFLADVLDGADQKAARAARRVEQRLAEFGIDLIDHELCDGARRVEFAGIAGILQIAEPFSYTSPNSWRSEARLKSISLSLLITCRIKVPDFM